MPFETSVLVLAWVAIVLMALGLSGWAGAILAGIGFGFGRSVIALAVGFIHKDYDGAWDELLVQRMPRLLSISGMAVFLGAVGLIAIA